MNIHQPRNVDNFTWYEVGKERPDGKYNLWRKSLVNKYWWDWVVVLVCDDFEEATEIANSKNRPKKARR